MKRTARCRLPFQRIREMRELKLSVPADAGGCKSVAVQCADAGYEDLVRDANEIRTENW